MSSRRSDLDEQIALNLWPRHFNVMMIAASFLLVGFGLALEGGILGAICCLEKDFII